MKTKHPFYVSGKQESRFANLVLQLRTKCTHVGHIEKKIKYNNVVTQAV